MIIIKEPFQLLLIHAASAHADCRLQHGDSLLKQLVETRAAACCNQIKFKCSRFLNSNFVVQLIQEGDADVAAAVAAAPAKLGRLTVLLRVVESLLQSSQVLAAVSLAVAMVR